ncbi:sodium transporter HKT1 [Sesamum indicum]|uniref:Sodium transporter HKT1 n=1 Tax=Sesamum indicum TaxID=4182 RepID=A0A6I9UIM1_SESIN|nr:sodium transporter HKT1 [Sesamum indicum]
MNNFADHCSEKLKHISCCLQAGLGKLHQAIHGSLRTLLQILFFQVNSFWIELGYFLTLSSLGFLALNASNPRTTTTFKPKYIDLFFTSVSASTVSSMSTVEMEVFSNTQLVLLTILMLVGGEVFTSMLGLHLIRAKIYLQKNGLITHRTVSDSSISSDPIPDSPTDHIELQMATRFRDKKSDTKPGETGGNLNHKSIKILAYFVACYLLVVHVAGSTLISIYFSLIPSARKVLKIKGLNMQTFSIFTTVSTFANCGFVPTNENMMAFKKNSGLLLILIPQILMGNTLYPVCLRSAIWAAEKMSRRAEFRYMLKNSRELGYGHLISGRHCVYLGITGVGFVIVQLVAFCLLEWKSEATGGLSAYQKLVGSLFQVVNSRHTGESVFDLSAISPAILVLFVAMMYLPPYTSFLPIDEAEEMKGEGEKWRKKKGLGEHIMFSQLTYLLIFVILICITERRKMKTDPLNFNVLSIVVEVVSAYGNVGFSVGYSCERQINPDGGCKDAWYGLAGRWSNQGKLVLILVMLFGRLKKFSMRGGRAWTHL